LGKMILVITGDVIDSTSNGLSLMRDRLETAFDLIEQGFPETYIRGAFQIVRGDGFQGAFGSVSRGLRCALFLYAFFKAQAKLLGKKTPSVGVRMGIGLGSGVIEPGGVLSSTGEAFILSGRALDSISKSKESTLKIRSSSGLLNEILEIEARMLETIVGAWTTGQAEILAEALLDVENKKSQNDIAMMLDKDQSVVSRQLKRSHYETIKLFCEHVEKITKEQKLVQSPSEGA